MKPFNVWFYIRYQEGEWAFRSMDAVPRVGDKCVFNDVRYLVMSVEWCMDTDATPLGRQRVNIELSQEQPRK